MYTTVSLTLGLAMTDGFLFSSVKSNVIDINDVAFIQCIRHEPAVCLWKESRSGFPEKGPLGMVVLLKL